MHFTVICTNTNKTYSNMNFCFIWFHFVPYPFFFYLLYAVCFVLFLLIFFLICTLYIWLFIYSFFLLWKILIHDLPLLSWQKSAYVFSLPSSIIRQIVQRVKFEKIKCWGNYQKYQRSRTKIYEQIQTQNI